MAAIWCDRYQSARLLGYSLGLGPRHVHSRLHSHEGQRVGTVILLLQGECVVADRALGEIARLGVGEILGKMSFVDSAPPSATVTASGDGLALFLDKEAHPQARSRRRLRQPFLPRPCDLPR